MELYKLYIEDKVKGDYSQVEVSGKKNIKTYLQIIGSKNNRILCRFPL